MTYKRKRPELIGQLTDVSRGPYKPGMYTVCGMLLHSSLVIDTDAVPLGLAAVRFRTRKGYQDKDSSRSKANPTRVAIEHKESHRWLTNLRESSGLLEQPQRLVHIGDREADIYELFCEAHDSNTHFLIRSTADRCSGADRRAGSGKNSPKSGIGRVSRRMRCGPVAGHHTLNFTGKNGKTQTARLAIKFRRLRILPPVGKAKRYPALTLTVIHAREISPPTGREPICWKLVTDLSITSLADAILMLRWYALRWNIETYHKVLKSGCGVEKAKLQTAGRLSNFVAVCMVIAWRVFHLTMLNRTDPKRPPSAVFTRTQLALLDELDAINAASRTRTPNRTPGNATLSSYLYALARLGGYLNRTHDGPPGNIVLWRGMTRLTDLQLGYELREKLVGN